MTTTSTNRGLNVALWAAQLLVAAPFVLFGSMKLFQPIAKLATMMAWAGQFPEAMVRLLGVVDIAGGLGLVLPGLTGIRPELTRAAAIGSLVLQCCALTFHLSRGEAALTPLNAVFIVLLLFILWGRSTRAPLAAR